MARTRQLKPGFFMDEDMAELRPWARLLFAGLWTIADRKGRLEDRPQWIRVQVFPYDDLESHKVSINALLDELAAPRKGRPGGFIERYEADGRRYIQVRNFEKHQHPHPKELPSQIPDPPKVESLTKPRPSRVRAAKGNGTAAKGNGTAVSQPRPSPAVPSVPSVPSEPSDSNGPSPADAGAAPPRPPPPEERPWSVEACDVWETNLGAVGSMAGRIGKALKPLLAKHGWGTVREFWERACAQAAAEPDPEYFTPEIFARTFQARLKAPTPRSRGRPSVGERQLAAAAEFIRGKGGGS